jgi:hypothetical protein
VRLIVDVRVKNKLEESDYFLYDRICSLMDPEKREEALVYCKMVGAEPHFFMIGPDECVALEFEDSVVIAVSGSDKDKAEWRGNFNAYRGPVDSKKKRPKGKKGFHYNFYLQARTLKRVVKQWLKSKDIKKPIIWVGHSRGGAITRTAHMLYNTEPFSYNTMSVPVDPPRSFTFRGWRWYKRNKTGEDICHRIKAFTFIVGVGSLPPAILGWVHRQSTLLRLPNVRGKLNHTAIREGLIRKFYGR